MVELTRIELVSESRSLRLSTGVVCYFVDGRFCTVGSTNLDARSLRFDYEENAVIIDRHTTKELDDMFDRDKHDSVRLTPEVWKETRSGWKKFVGWFSHLLQPFL